MLLIPYFIVSTSRMQFSCVIYYQHLLLITNIRIAILNIALFCSIFWLTIKNYIYLLFLGYYCLANTEFETQYPCPNGTFNNQTGGISADYCKLCTPGHYCPTDGLAVPVAECDPGWYCVLGSWDSQPAYLGNETRKLASISAGRCGKIAKINAFILFVGQIT